MANNPKRIQDPTEAAMSAIQEALNLRDDPPATPRVTADADLGAPVSASNPFAPPIAPTEPAPPAREGRRRPTRSAPPIDEDLFLQETVGRAEPAAPVRTRTADVEEVRPSQRAANDDRQSVGQVLQSMQRRPSRAPYMAAFFLSAVWVLLGIVVGASYFGTDLKAIANQGAHPTLFALAAGIALPVLLFYVLAHMVRRAQELRIIARSMTEAAMRLAEPETIARESIVSVGQAIRREVAAMGDGVERALARAAELEALVHNEVAALERAYNDNELRIRGLIEDLANQRDSLVGQAEQVRNAITGVHLGLTQDIASVSEMVAASVNDAAQRVTRTLAEKGEHITLALGRAGDTMIDAIGERGGDLLEQMTRTSEEVSRTLETASDKMTSNIDVKSDHLSAQIADLTVKLAQMLSSRLDHVTDNVSQRTMNIAETLMRRTDEISTNLTRTTDQLTEQMTVRARELTDTMIDAGGRLAETIAARADDVNNTLKATGESLVLDLTLRGGDVVGKLEETGSRITETIITRGTKVSDTFREAAEQLEGTINAKGDSVREMLGLAPAVVRGDVHPRRRRACREDHARLPVARRPDHAASRRIRPHREGLRRRTGGAAEPAHRGSHRRDALACRQFRHARQRAHDRIRDADGRTHHAPRRRARHAASTR